MMEKQRDIKLDDGQVFEIFKDSDIYLVFKNGVSVGVLSITKSKKIRAKSITNDSKLFSNHYDAVEFLSNYLEAN